MRRFGGRRTLPAPAVALALAVLAPLQGAAQQRYAVPVPTAARPPALPADASAPAVCATVSQCILFPASRVDLVAPAIRAELVAPAYVCADPALAAPPTRALVCPAVRVPPVRASTYPGVAVWSFAGAIVGAVALAATGYALGLLGDAGYDSWLTPSDALATLGFVVGYPAGGAVGAVIGARRAGLRPHTGTVVLVSYLGAAAGVLVGAGVSRAIPTEGLPAIVAVIVHLGFTTVAAHESGR